MNSYTDLIAAGYKPEQILSCPLNDYKTTDARFYGKCPCEKSVMTGGALLVACALGENDAR